MKYRALAALSLFALHSAIAGCNGSGLDDWQGYPSLNSATARSSRWLVVKCTVSNDRKARYTPPEMPAEFDSLDDYIETFLSLRGSQTGNLGDYLHDVTYGKLLFDSKILGWYDAPFKQASGLSRQQRIEQCVNSISDADAAGLDFSDYDGIIAVTNTIDDGGACDHKKVKFSIKGGSYDLGCLIFDPASMYTAFAGHELGHGLGLAHSADTSKVDYTDRYDMMSALRTFRFVWNNYPGTGAAVGQGSAGPGFSVPNLLQLDAIPAGRIAEYRVGDAQKRVSLTALSHPGGSNPLAVRITGPNLETYTIEYRQSDGWDAGYPLNLVLVHQYVPGGTPSSIAFVGPTAPGGVGNGGWAQGQLLIARDAGFSMYVESIDTASGTAVVTVNGI